MQSEVLTAVRQVFGVMTGSEAHPVSEEPELTVDLCASIDLDERDQGLHLRVVLQSSRALAVELCTLRIEFEIGLPQPNDPSCMHWGGCSFPTHTTSSGAISRRFP